jgi:predicted O-methyltransferase YrrM
MKTSLLLFSTVGLGLLVAACAGKGKTEDAGGAAPPAGDPAAARTLDASRKEFLQAFKRQALDSAADDATFLRILVAGLKAKRGIEIGSFKGFGAMNMGMSFERNGGHLFTHEIDAKIADECRENLKKVGLEKTVTVVTGDALKTLPQLEGEFDFVFIDAKKDDYFKYFKIIEPKLKPGAVIVAYNTIKSAKAMPDYLDYVFKSPDYDSVTIRVSSEKGDGMTVTCKLR